MNGDIPNPEDGLELSRLNKIAEQGVLEGGDRQHLVQRGPLDHSVISSASVWIPVMYLALDVREEVAEPQSNGGCMEGKLLSFTEGRQ